ncbi:unnamed protein product, partial [marine sediment metagenome]
MTAEIKPVPSSSSNLKLVFNSPVDVLLTQSYAFFPAIRCWVKHLLEGKYNAEKKSLFTIFGAL